MLSQNVEIFQHVWLKLFSLQIGRFGCKIRDDAFHMPPFVVCGARTRDNRTAIVLREDNDSAVVSGMLKRKRARLSTGHHAVRELGPIHG